MVENELPWRDRSSRNVFDRLGKDANMRGTLIRRQEQERAQNSIGNQVRFEIHVTFVGNIPIVKLCCVLLAIKKQDDELVISHNNSLVNKRY